jgi:transcriptional regulator with XRE-family HTH domain
MQTNNPILLFRVKSGLTQTEVARFAGIRRQTLSKIESGESVPRGPTISMIAKALGIDPAIIINFYSAQTHLIVRRLES